MYLLHQGKLIHHYYSEIKKIEIIKGMKKIYIIEKIKRLFTVTTYYCASFFENNNNYENNIYHLFNENMRAVY